MALFFLIVAGCISLMLAATTAAFFVLGLGLLFTRFKKAGLFIAAAPSAAVLGSLAFSWGLAFICDRLGARAGLSADAVEVWGVLTFLAWPAGLFFGGFLGLSTGLLCAALLARRTGD